MTDTVPAIATAMPSRRGLIAKAGMLASIGAAGATLAMPALAAAAGPIESMHAEHVRLTGIYDRAIETTWDAEERYEEPARPRWHPWTAEGGYKLEELPDNKCRCYLDDSDKNIATLKALISEPFVFDPTFAVVEQQHQLRIERAKKTLAEIEAWKAEDKRRADAAGLTQAREAEDRARTAVKEHAAAVFAIEPATFRELAFRAAVLCMTWDQREANELPEILIELAGIEPHHLG